jgi:hypothetical protein
LKRGDVTILAVAVAFLAGGAGFALGHFTAAKAATSAAVQQPGSGQGSGGFGGAGAGGGFRRGGFGTRGTVSSVSGSTITISDQSGTSRTVTVSSGTTYLNGADRSAAALSNVTTGTTILAAGQTASDGSISATRIIINPPAPRGFSGGAPAAPQTQSN